MSEPKATYRRVTVMENCEMAANGRFDAMTALITGGASGIGCAVASRVIAEGGLVTLWDVHHGPKLTPFRSQAIAGRCRLRLRQ